MTLFLFLVGLVLLIVGAEWLVRGASQVAIAIGISRLVVGLTVVAFGTSAPELATNVQSTFTGEPDIAIGNVVGSNISNILLVLGITALISKLNISEQLIRIDVPLMIVLSGVMYWFAWDGIIHQIESILLVMTIVGYTVFLVVNSKKEMLVQVTLTITQPMHDFEKRQLDFLHQLAALLALKPIPTHIRMLPLADYNKKVTVLLPKKAQQTLLHMYHTQDSALLTCGITEVEIFATSNIAFHYTQRHEENVSDFDTITQETFKLTVAHLMGCDPDFIHILHDDDTKNDNNAFVLQMPQDVARELVANKDNLPVLAQRANIPPSKRGVLYNIEIHESQFSWAKQLFFLIVGLALLIVGARWLVNGAVVFATMLGISKLIVGLTIVAVGTSLPEIATSVIAGLRNEADIVAGNVVGSNIFNIAMVLGIVGIITDVPVSQQAIHFDIPVMVFVALLCLPVFISERRIGKLEGSMFLLYYAAYITYLVLVSLGSVWLVPFTTAMYVIVPITVVVLLVVPYIKPKNTRGNKQLSQ